MLFRSSANINAATPTISQVANYDFSVPERVFYNPYDKNKMWVASFGHGLQWGDITATGIADNNLSDSEITISPNPFRESTTIRFKNSNENYTLEMYNPIGQLVMKKTYINGNTYTLNNQGFPKGVYLLKVFAKDKKTVSKKLLIK